MRIITVACYPDRLLGLVDVSQGSGPADRPPGQTA